MPGESSAKPWWRRWFCNRSDRAAARSLKALGYRILATNVRTPQGEIDAVALDGTTLVFVEVRSTGVEDVNRPAMSVDGIKQRRLTALAVHYLQKHRLLDRPARFDVLAVSWPDAQREPRIVHYADAFPATGRFQMFN